MKTIMKVIGALVAALAITFSLAACTSSDYDQRKAKQDEVTLDNSLGIEAQKERLSREDDVNAIRYVYIFAPMTDKVVGYYTIKGGVYGADTQLAPEQDIVCPWSTSAESCNAVDSAKDNGTYGGSDEGVFFITTEDVLIETTFDYIQSDAPIHIYADAPKLTE